MARAAVQRGEVRVGGAPTSNAARLVASSEPILMVGPPPPYVSRGGEKLAGALDAFDVAVAGRRALDAGSSTGGFTDCLLQRGAATVVAVDVGTNQLHERLRRDARVELHEQTNLRWVEAGTFGDPCDLAVADVSFISLTQLVGPVLTLLTPDAELLWLVKPQFEVPRDVADRGKGVVSDPAEWIKALHRVAGALEAAGAAIMGAMPSPLPGAAGNIEFFLHARAPGAAEPAPSLLIDFAAVAAAASALRDR